MAKKSTKKTNTIQNGLTEAILGYNPGGIGTQITKVDTIFKNLRYYLVSNMRQPLSQAYVEIGVIRTICDVPVDDGMRGGFKFSSKQLSPEELEKLQFTCEQNNDVGVMAEALKWDRLYGGAGILIITGDDWETPLDIESLEEGDENIEFKAVDMWELYWDHQNIAGDGEPLPTYEFYQYYGKKIHKSRVLILKGIKAPAFIRPRLRGWGLSVVEVFVTSVNQYLKSNNLTFEILDEFKIDVYRLKGLAEALLVQGGDAKIRNRVATTNASKSFQNAIVLDAEDEYNQKQLSFAGLAEAQTGIRMQVASDLRMPLTKIFGISAAGFSSGEDDIENYNAMVEGTIRSRAKHHFITMGKIRCMQLFGYIPEDLNGAFEPLRILSSEQQETVKNAKFTRLLQAAQLGLCTVKEFKDGCNAENLLPVKLDTSIEKVEPIGQSEGEGGLKMPEKKSATEAEGAKS